MDSLDTFLRGNLKTRHLVLLIALDDHRSIGKVATLVHRTQPAVSKALGELESGLGLRLFERTSHGLEPTAYGQCLVRHAREWQKGLSFASEELHGLATGRSGRINVGVLAGASVVLYPAALATMKKRMPYTSVQVREGPLTVLLPELRLGELDLIVGTLPTQRVPRDLDQEDLLNDAPNVVARKGHPLAEVRDLRIDHMADMPWVLPPIGTVLRGATESMFGHYGVPMPRNVVETVSIHVICAYVGASDALALMSRSAATHYSALGLVQILQSDLPLIGRPVGMIWSRERPISPGTQTMMDCLREAAIAKSS